MFAENRHSKPDLESHTIVSLKLDFAAQNKGGMAVSAVWTLVYLLVPLVTKEHANAHRRDGLCPCERTYMKSTSESLSHPETSNGRGAGGNCVVVRRGGEQPEADLRSQTKVNPIRFSTAASLRASGEASGKSHIRFLTHSSYRGEKRAVGDGWGGNAGKVSYGSVENCLGRNPRKRGWTEVRAAIVVKKRGNARGVKGGRKVERQKP